MGPLGSITIYASGDTNGQLYMAEYTFFAGPSIVLGGIINGLTGFNFSGDSHNNVYYGAVVAVVIVLVLALLGWKRWSKNKQAKHSRMLDDDELHGGSLSDACVAWSFTLGIGVWSIAALSTFS